MTRPRLLALLLALVTLLVYRPAGSDAFVNLDDPDYITENPPVRDGLNAADLRWALTAFHAGNWHPLTWMSHQLDCQLFGLDAGAQHLVNVCFHAANVALVFGLMWQLTGRAGAAVLLAGLFGWHPLRVESVAWIAERKDVLSSFFALLALLAWLAYGRRGRRRDFWLAWLAMLLGLLAKPMVVTLPLVFLLLDYWPLGRAPLAGAGAGGGDEFIAPGAPRRSWRGLLGEKWPFLVLAAGSCWITLLAQKSGGALVSLTRLPLAGRLENVPVSVVRYAGKLLWPVDLSVLYVRQPVQPWVAAACALGLLLVSVAVWRRRGSQPWLGVGWLWFLGMLTPVLGLVQAGNEALADRYTYLPSLGFFLALVRLAQAGVVRWKIPPPWPAAAGGVILAVCLARTEQQLAFWRDSETLLQHAIALNPRNVTALTNLGVTFQQQNRLAEAGAAYRQAEQFEDGSAFRLHDDYGTLLGRLGRPQAALAEYLQAIRENPGDAFGHNAAGSEYARLGDAVSARRELTTAGGLDPANGWPQVELAQLDLQSGDVAAAVRELRAAARRQPDDFRLLAVAARLLAANADAAGRDGALALQLAARANDLSGRLQPGVYDVLGMACAELGDFTNAAACEQKALDLAASLPAARTAGFQKRLALFQNHQPWRESFRGSAAGQEP